MTTLQLPEGYTVRKVKGSLKVVPMRKRKVVIAKEMLKGIRVDHKGQMDVLRSIQATYQASKSPFTAEEMLKSLEEVANGEQVFNLNQRRINNFLSACCNMYGLKELADGRYTA